MGINSSLKISLLKWFLLLSILPVLIVSILNYQNSSKNLYEISTQRLQETSQQNVRFINNWFNSRESDIKSWSQYPHNIKFLEELSDKFSACNTSLEEFSKSFTYVKTHDKYNDNLRTLSKEYDYIYDIFLIDNKGNILYSLNKEDDFATNLINGKYSSTKFATSYKKTLTSGRITFSDIQRYKPSNNTLAGFLNAPLINDNGEIIGVLSLQIRDDSFIFPVKHSNDYNNYFLGQDKYLRSEINSPNDALNIKLNEAQFSVFLNQNSEIHKPIYYTNLFNKNVMGIYHYVKIFDVTWILVSEIDEDILFESTHTLTKKMLLSVGLLVFILVFISFFIAKKITKPIERLTQANIMFTMGKRDIQIETSDENKELSQLTLSFNSMINSLNENENELKKQTKNAQIALEAKSQFLASMSHEIRTPMNGVIGMLGLLLNTKLTKQQLDYVSIAQNSANSLLGLINDILDFSKVEAGKMDLEIIEFNIYDELRAFLQTMKFSANQKGIQLLLDMSKLEHNIVISDPTRIRQILNNLVANAIKFTSDGDIRVIAVLKKHSATDADLIVTIEDDGIGIPQDKIEHLFESFSQVDKSTTRKYGGTGLGLAIVKKLCVLMGGDIKVKSELGVGSSFEFYIPIGLSDKPMLIQENNYQVTELTADLDKDLNLLLVEDNITNQIVAQGILKNFGFNVDIANNGQEAIEKLQNCESNKYSLILMDCQMPIMDGYQATRAIRSAKAGNLFKDIPIVAMTANAMRGDKEKCFNAGMDDYISKPIDLNALENILKKWTKNSIIQKVNKQEKSEEIPQNSKSSVIWDKEAIFQRLSNDKPLIEKIIKAFINDINTLLQELSISMHQNNMQRCRLHLHSIKGSASNIGANNLTKLAVDIENSLKENTLDFLKENYIQLEFYSKEILDLLKEYLRENQSVKNFDNQITDIQIKDDLIQLQKELESGAFIDTDSNELFHINTDEPIKTELIKLKEEIEQFEIDNSIKTISSIISKLGQTDD